MLSHLLELLDKKLVILSDKSGGKTTVPFLSVIGASVWIHLRLLKYFIGQLVYFLNYFWIGWKLIKKIKIWLKVS